MDIDPLEGWAVGRAVLVGDAAHAMTPNQGRGASEAMEDAVVLADQLRAADLASRPDVERALASYERLRRPQTRAVQVASRRAGKLILAENPLVCGVRDGLLLKRFFKRRLLREIAREFAPSAPTGG